VTLYLDTSALLKRYVDEPGTEVVVRAMTDDPAWAASAMAQPETELALCHLLPDDESRMGIVERFRRDWSRFFVVPVDPECLRRAVEIGCEYHVRTLDALHLAAAERLPAPVVMVSFDARQRAAAAAIGLHLIAAGPSA